MNTITTNTTNTNINNNETIVKTGNKKYRKDKPWDTDDIDHWKIDVCIFIFIMYLFIYN